MKRLFTVTALVGAGLLGPIGLSPAAKAAAPPDRGWITGVASTSSEARAVPCAGEAPAAVGEAMGSWRDVGATVCFPKRSSLWYADQGPEGCWLKSDVTTGFRMHGTCVMTIDMGTYVKAWAPPEAVHEEFLLVWL